MEKFALLIATKKGYTALSTVLSTKYRNSIGMVISFHESNVRKDWCKEMQKLCKNNNIPFYLFVDVKNQIPKLLIKHDIGNVVAMSWKYYIPLEINKYLKNKLIIFHDSLLPKYRGFAPTPNAIINGEKEIGVTALFASEKIDEGDIISQVKIPLNKDTCVKEAIDLLSQKYGDLLLKIVKAISNNARLKSHKQNESLASYCIWRNVDDCKIDWSMSSKDIYNFVRAVGDPYPGAYSIIDNKKIIIEQVEIIKDLNFVRREAGKVWFIHDNHPEIICGAGMIRIIKANDQSGKEYHFNKLRTQLK